MQALQDHVLTPTKTTLDPPSHRRGTSPLSESVFVLEEDDQTISEGDLVYASTVAVLLCFLGSFS